MKRREFFSSVGQGSLAAGILGHTGLAGAAGDDPDAIYRRSITVDALCIPTDDVPLSPPFLSRERVEALKSSGISLISQDVGSGVWPGIGKRDWTVLVHQISQWNEFLNGHPETFYRVLSARDVESAKSLGRVGVVFNMQDTSPFGLHLDRLGLFRDLGLRQLQLCHNERNHAVDSCLEPSNAGLSRFGREMVADLNKRRILIDIAHVGEQSCLETIKLSKAPVLVSHSGCYAVCPHPRSKSDRVIKDLAERGGVLCLYNMGHWMTSDPSVTLEVFLRHLKHALTVAGEDHVGFGQDGDPAFFSAKFLEWELDFSRRRFVEHREYFPQLVWPIQKMRFDELSGPHRLLNLSRAMDKAGYAARTIEKVIGGNYFRLFKDVVG